MLSEDELKASVMANWSKEKITDQLFESMETNRILLSEWQDAVGALKDKVAENLQDFRDAQSAKLDYRRKVVQFILDADLEKAKASRLIASSLLVHEYDEPNETEEMTGDLDCVIYRILESQFCTTSRYTVDLMLEAAYFGADEEGCADEIFQVMDALAPTLSPDRPFDAWTMANEYMKKEEIAFDDFFKTFDLNAALMLLRR